MKTICIVCDEEFEENDYKLHMDKKHPEGQVAAVQKQKAIKKNVPKTADLPPGINPDDLPTPEFMETMAEITKEQEKPPVEAPVAPPTPSTPSPEVKPLLLTYKWVRNCPTCNTPINTIMVEVKGVFVEVEYCISHKQLKAIEVQPIEKEKK